MPHCFRSSWFIAHRSSIGLNHPTTHLPCPSTSTHHRRSGFIPRRLDNKCCLIMLPNGHLRFVAVQVNTTSEWHLNYASLTREHRWNCTSKNEKKPEKKENTLPIWQNTWDFPLSVMVVVVFFRYSIRFTHIFQKFHSIWNIWSILMIFRNV